MPKEDEQPKKKKKDWLEPKVEKIDLSASEMGTPICKTGHHTGPHQNNCNPGHDRCYWQQPWS